MPKKKKRLSLNKLTIVSLSEQSQSEVMGGYVTYLSNCCTVNMSTCIVIETECFTTDTYQPGGTACP